MAATKYLVKHPIFHGEAGKKPVTFKRGTIVPASKFSDEDIEAHVKNGVLEAVEDAPVEEEKKK